MTEDQKAIKENPEIFCRVEKEKKVCVVNRVCLGQMDPKETRGKTDFRVQSKKERKAYPDHEAQKALLALKVPQEGQDQQACQVYLEFKDNLDPKENQANQDYRVLKE